MLDSHIKELLKLYGSREQDAEEAATQSWGLLPPQARHLKVRLGIVSFQSSSWIKAPSEE